MECLTKIYESDGKNFSPRECVGAYGSYHPVVIWDGIYWGAHGGKTMELRYD